MCRRMKSYDLLFKMPYGGQFTADGARDTDSFFAKIIDQLADQLLEERALPH